MKRYIKIMARTLSGEALVANVLSLLRTMRDVVSGKKEEKIRRALEMMRREANKRNPPAQQAAEAVRLRTLKEVTEEAKITKLTRSERQALDIFVIAFVTMSRVGEVASLRVEEVSRDGATIAIRPKTNARTWKRLVKRVSNMGGLEAAEKLARYREEARKQGRKTVFIGKSGGPPETATITRHLKKLGKKVNCGTRLTSHSARKGAAVEAVLNGVPIPVVQALGGWKDLNSLQAYIGEAIRRTTPLLEMLGEGVEGSGMHEEGGWTRKRAGWKKGARTRKRSTRTKERKGQVEGALESVFSTRKLPGKEGWTRL